MSSSSPSPLKRRAQSRLLYSPSDFIFAAHKERSLPKAMTLEQLESETLLLLEDGHCLRDHALSACTLQRLQERRNFSATSLATLIQMVGHGYGDSLARYGGEKWRPSRYNPHCPVSGERARAHNWSCLETRASACYGL